VKKYVPRSIQNIHDRTEARNESITEKLFSEELATTFEVTIYTSLSPETETPIINGCDSSNNSNYYFCSARSKAGHHDHLVFPESAKTRDEYEKFRNAHFQAITKKTDDLPTLGDVWMATYNGGNLVTLVSLQRQGTIITKFKEDGPAKNAHSSSEEPTALNSDYADDSIYTKAARLRASGTPVPGPSTPKVLSGDEKLAQDAGIPVAILRAFRSVETGALPASSLRFEPHKWKRSKGTIPPKGYTPKSNKETWSVKSSETNRAAFEAAYAIDQDVAVKSTSFGYYQVLGGKGIKIYETASKFWTAFQANPEKVSDELVVLWFKDTPEAQAAANSLDFTTLAVKYNGSRQAEHYYDIRIAESYKAALDLEK
tara:strand:- start:13048 stop:14160 length:1113 start_codon:yes stop_codon:yes gene_type:complete